MCERTETDKELLMNIYKHLNSRVKFYHKRFMETYEKQDLQNAMRYGDMLTVTKEYRGYVRATIGNEMQNWDELDEIWNPHDYEKIEEEEDENNM